MLPAIADAREEDVEAIGGPRMDPCDGPVGGRDDGVVAADCAVTRDADSRNDDAIVDGRAEPT
jgi:hypothetical protein